MKNLNDKECYALKIKEAVEVMGISERKIREMIATNELPHFRVGRSVRIPWQPLKEWMDNGGTCTGKYEATHNPHKKAGAV